MNEMVSQDVAQPSPAVAGVVYVTRILPPDEWPRLVGTEAETVWPYLPETAHVLVIERGQEIVGCWVLAPLFHVECLWIAPTCRKTTSVARRLWSDMRRLIRRLKIRSVITGAVSEDVRQLLHHVGAEPLPGTHYVMRFPER